MLIKNIALLMVKLESLFLITSNQYGLQRSLTTASLPLPKSYQIFFQQFQPINKHVRVMGTLGVNFYSVVLVICQRKIISKYLLGIALYYSLHDSVNTHSSLQQIYFIKLLCVNIMKIR